MEVSAGATVVDLPPGADLYLVNDRDLTYAPVRSRPQDCDVLLGEAGALPTSLARAVAVSCGYDMLLAGETSTAAVVDSVVASWAGKSSLSLVEPYLHWSRTWPSTGLDSLMHQVASLAALLTDDPSHRRVALRILAGTASGPALMSCSRPARTISTCNGVYRAGGPNCRS